jgi:transcriptional regulator with PAS, ATPase and Fis domain
VINLVVPPLRERKDDIPILIDYFLNKECKKKSIPLKTCTKRTLEKLMDYAWPGNIRELENEIERLVILTEAETKILPDLLSVRIREKTENSKSDMLKNPIKLKNAIEEIEKTIIFAGLKRNNWNKSKLAKELGISRAGLLIKVEKYNLDKRKLSQPNEAA